MLLLLVCFACQSNRQQERVLKKYQVGVTQKTKKDSLNRAFCACLLADSLSNQEKIQQIDSFLEEQVDINKPCSSSKLVSYKTIGNLIQNLGVSFGNLVMKGKPFHKKSSYKKVSRDYPPVLLVAKDTFMIRYLTERGSNLNQATSTMSSLLEFWVSENDLNMLRFLFELGAKPTPLRIKTANEKVIDFLLEKGASTQAIDKVMLMQATNFRHFVSKYKVSLASCSCLEFSKSIQIPPFDHLNYERAEFLLEKGVSKICVNGRIIEKVMDMSFDKKEVAYGVKERKSHQKKWFELFKKHQISYNQCASFDRALLTKAIIKNDIDMIQLLLANGADPNFEYVYYGKPTTPLQEARKKLEQAQNSTHTNKEENIKNVEKVLKLLEER